MYDASSERLPYKEKLLNYASYLVVEEYKDRYGEEPNGVFFNKIMSLLNKRNPHFNLPHYWYRYGDQVCRQKMPTALSWNSEETNETTVDWRYRRYDYFKELDNHPIEEDVKLLIEDYSNNFEKLIDDVYSYAPFDFQRKFLNLRKTFYGIKNAYNWDIKSYKELSKPIFLETFNKFPIHEFKDLKEEYKLVKAFIETKLESESWRFKILEDISKDFWFLFCYHLRLNPKGRENIPSDILHYWKNSLPNNTSRHRKSIADKIIDNIDQNKDLLENETIKNFYEWRIKDKKETKEAIENFIDIYNSKNRT